MRIDEVVEFAEKRFGYKPNWNIRVTGGEFFEDCVGFRFEMNVPDIKDGDRVVPVISHMNLTVQQLEGMDEHELTHCLVAEIRTMEVHEMDEWFAIDRRQIAGPHHVRNYVNRGAVEGVRRGDLTRRDPNRFALQRRSPGRAAFHGPGVIPVLSQAPDFGGPDKRTTLSSGEERPVSIPVKVRGRWSHLLQKARGYLAASTSTGDGQ